MNIAAILLGLAALGGVTMAGLRLQGTPRPPTWMALGHGAIAAAGLVTLAYFAFTTGVPQLAGVALGILVLAALGGATIFLLFHLKEKPLPIPLVLGHGLIAAAGYALLLLSIFSIFESRGLDMMRYSPRGISAREWLPALPAGIMAALAGAAPNLRQDSDCLFFRRTAMARSIVSLLALGLIAVSLAQSAAQNAVTIREHGKVLAISPGNITASAGGKTYTLKFKPEQSVVFVQGLLKPEELQQGMIVRVTGTLKGTAMDGEVSEVKIYTTADGYQSGVLQDAPDQPATITGQLASSKNGVLTISAGRKRVTAKLAEGAKIILDTKDYSIVKGGEPIYIDGRTTDGKNVTARKIVITVGQPLEETKPTGKAKKAK